MTAPDARALLDELEKADERAWAELARLCEGGRFVMRVPVDEARDSDTLLGGGMQMSKLLAALRGALDLADELEGWPSSRIMSPHDAAARLRSTVAAALEGSTTP